MNLSPTPFPDSESSTFVIQFTFKHGLKHQDRLESVFLLYRSKKTVCDHV